MKYTKITPPADGRQITFRHDSSNTLQVPDNPVIPFIEGDGIGVDVTPAMKIVVDAAINKTYGGARKIQWWEIPAGKKAFDAFGEWLPEETVQAIRDFKVAIKGPLMTPVGGGIRSLNVAIRQQLELFACVRPVRWFQGVPAPVTDPGALDVVIFRENSEDLYMGIEFKAGSNDAKVFIDLIAERTQKNLRPESAIGIKPISQAATLDITRAAIEYAIARKRKSLTIVHKGNIMKFTEGAFRDWALEFIKTDYREHVVTETEIREGSEINGRIVIRDRIADAMFQELLLRPQEHDVIVTPNLNGDYISDACAAQAGGLGLAPGANIGKYAAVFEATHGTAPGFAGQDKLNPGSIILSACMMLDHIGWGEAAADIEKAMEKTIMSKHVTYDLADRMEGSTLLSCSAFARQIADNLA